MVLAMVYPEAERGGARKRGSSKLSLLEFSKMRLSQARSVLRHSRELDEHMLKGITLLDEALQEVKE